MGMTVGPDSAALFDCKMSHPTATFCDGFEGPMMESWGYKVVDNATVEATTTRAYRGSKALETATANIDGYKAARWGRWFDEIISSGDLYYRAFYWLSAATSIDEQVSIISLGYGVDPYPSTFLMLAPGELHLNANNNTSVFQGDLPRDRWVCVEMHIAVSQTGQASIRIDGGAALVTGVTDTLVGGEGYTNLDVGVHYATPNQSPVLMWVDEVIVDTAPIGCN